MNSEGSDEPVHLHSFTRGFHSQSGDVDKCWDQCMHI